MGIVYVDDYEIPGSPWSTPITNAINAAGPGGKIVFGSRQYIIEQSVYPLANQEIVGQGRVSTEIRLDFSNITELPTGGAMIIGTFDSPGVIVDGITFNGGRSDCGLPDYATDPIICPEGKGGGVAARVNWTVKNCRFTNMNGFKVSVFGAHNALIENNLFDCDAPGTSGDPDNIGGGAGACGVIIRGNTISQTAKGSGIDITNAYDLTVDNNFVGFRSLILEGIVNATVTNNVVSGSGTGSDRGNINIKSNGQYGSSVENGVVMPLNTVIRGNSVISPDGAPGIVLAYTDARIGSAANLTTGGNNLIIDNTIIDSKGLGIVIFGDYRAKTKSDTIIGNRVFGVRDLTWSSGVGTFKNAGIGLGVGINDVIGYNYVTDATHGISLTTSGTQAAGTGRVIKTKLFGNRGSVVSSLITRS